MKGRGKGVLCKNMQWDDSDAKIRSNLFFCLGAEGQRKLQLKRPNLDIQTQTRKNRMQILENKFVISRIMAFGMFIFICLKQRNKGTLEQLLLDLFELAFWADCGEREYKWVWDMFTAHMSNKKTAEGPVGRNKITTRRVRICNQEREKD